MGLSIRAYARHRGVSHVAVKKAIDSGRITPEADGTIEPNRADQEWAQNTVPARKVAPVKAAVFPLVRKDGMPEVAKEIYKDLKRSMNVFYDEKAAVGRRYRRQDEIGTPFCITVDGQTLTDGTVTIRDRDSLKQWRVHKNECLSVLKERF